MTIIILAPLLYSIVMLILLLPFLFCKKRGESCIGKNILLLIPTYNDAENITDVLESIKQQENANSISIIIINDGSTDNTCGIVSKWIGNKMNCALINIPENTGSKGRALSYAKCKITPEINTVICIDGDTILDKYAIQNCIDELYSNSEYAAVCGFLQPLEFKRNTFSAIIQKSELYGFFHGLKYAQSIFGNVNTLAGALVAFKTQALNEIGWFDEWLVEDICWTWKAKSKGWKVGFAENAYAKTNCPGSVLALYKQRRRWARGKIEALKVAFNQNSFNFCHIIPWFLFAIMQLLTPVSILFGAIFCHNELILSLAIIFIIHFIYAFKISSSVGLRKIYYSFAGSLITAVILDVILFIPHLQGVYDEIANNKKTWITR